MQYRTPAGICAKPVVALGAQRFGRSVALFKREQISNYGIPIAPDGSPPSKHLREVRAFYPARVAVVIATPRAIVWRADPWPVSS
jgi:hypothetical protein